MKQSSVLSRQSVIIKWSCYCVAALFFTLSLWHTTAQAADEGDIRTAKRLIESNKEKIMFFAHPTTTLQSISFDGTNKYSSGSFRITYTFNWKSDITAENNWTRFGFQFDSDGKIKDIEMRGRSNFLPPFMAASLVLVFVKQWLSENPEYSKHPLVQYFLKTSNAKGLLRMYLFFLQK